MTETGSRDKRALEFETDVPVRKESTAESKGLKMVFNVNNNGSNRRDYYYYCYFNGIVRL